VIANSGSQSLRYQVTPSDKVGILDNERVENVAIPSLSGHSFG